MLSRLKGVLPRSLKQAVSRLLQSVWESTAYRFSRNGSGGLAWRHIVFVCKGNICRSTFADYYLRSRIPEGSMKVESCGLDVDQGAFSPPHAVQVGREFGLELSGHRSKGVGECDLYNADLIVPMEYRHYLRLVEMFPEQRSKIRLLRDFAPWPVCLMCNTYDPYGLGHSEFRRCFRGMKRALDKLLANTK